MHKCSTCTLRKNLQCSHTQLEPMLLRTLSELLLSSPPPPKPRGTHFSRRGTAAGSRSTTPRNSARAGGAAARRGSGSGHAGLASRPAPGRRCPARVVELGCPGPPRPARPAPARATTSKGANFGGPSWLQRLGGQTGGTYHDLPLNDPPK